MAKQTIGIGTAPNDGTGDALRTAFGKVNDNFTELYTNKADASAVTAGLDEKIDKTAIDTDSTFAADSDDLVPSQSAVKAAIAALGGGASAWTAYTPTVSAGTGSFTSASATGAYLDMGQTVLFRQTITLTTIGTGGANVQATLPFSVKGSVTCTGKHVNSGKSLQVEATGSGTGRTYSLLYDGSFPFTSGAILNISGFYEKY